MTSRRTRSSSSKESPPAKRSLLTDVPSSSRSMESTDEYRTPSRLLDECNILPLANMAEMTKWWKKEHDCIQKSFIFFVEQKYFVNKFGFIGILYHPEHELGRSHAVFMPAGCSKTIMSLSLEFFFSYRISEAERDKVRSHYSHILSFDLITEHEGKYYVLRLSLRDFPYKPGESFDVTLFHFLEDAMESIEPDLFKDADIQKHLDTSFLLSKVISWLHTKYGRRLIVIIDEVDYPTNLYMHKNASEAHEKKMKTEFNNVLTNLSRHSLVERVVLFGIHIPHGVLRSRAWRILDFRDKDCAQFLMFTRIEVEAVLKRYDLTDKISAVEKHYGNYTYGFFCPASISAFVSRNGDFSLYKWCRRSCDIIDLNLKAAESWLAPFVDDKIHKKYIDTNAFYFIRPLRESIALYHYVFAGLLCMPLPADRPVAGIYELSAGNLENLNIIAYFLERIVDIHSNYALIDVATKALNACNFSALASVFNRIFETFKPMELTCERNYQNSMKVFFKFIPGWEERSEVDEDTVNILTGDSGRTDFRVWNTQLKYLFIFELKFIRGREVTENPDLIEEKKEEAFQQIIDRGYVTPKDMRSDFVKILEVATVCHGKRVTMFDRPHVRLVSESIATEGNN